jgi:hypothetical protein
MPNKPWPDPDRYQHSDCAKLAVEIHRRTGWPIWAVCDTETVVDGQQVSAGWLHALIQTPDGPLSPWGHRQNMLDSRGLRTADEVMDDFEGMSEGEDGDLWVQPFPADQWLPTEPADAETSAMADQVLERLDQLAESLSS